MVGSAVPKFQDFSILLSAIRQDGVKPIGLWCHACLRWRRRLRHQASASRGYEQAQMGGKS
jgi:hypothetical protein